MTPALKEWSAVVAAVADIADAVPVHDAAALAATARRVRASVG